MQKIGLIGVVFRWPAKSMRGRCVMRFGTAEIVAMMYFGILHDIFFSNVHVTTDSSYGCRNVQITIFGFIVLSRDHQALMH